MNFKERENVCTVCVWPLVVVVVEITVIIKQLSCRLDMSCEYAYIFCVEHFFFLLKVHLSNYCIFQCQVRCQFVLGIFIRIDFKDERKFRTILSFVCRWNYIVELQKGYGMKSMHFTWLEYIIIFIINKLFAKSTCW